MERITFSNPRNKTLVGHLYPHASDTVIILVHGFTGDKSEWGRFDLAAKALHHAGYTVFAFDFAGCGESDDDSLTLDKQGEDLQTVIRNMQRRGYHRIGLLTHSLGGLVALRTFSSAIQALVLWAPVTDKVTYSWDKRFSSEQLKELHQKGYLTKKRTKGIRKTFIIDQRMLRDREEVNQQALLKPVTLPVLIIHGTRDAHVPFADSEKAITRLPSGSQLVTLEGADHGFHDQIERVVALSTQWFLNHLPL